MNSTTVDSAHEATRIKRRTIEALAKLDDVKSKLADQLRHSIDHFSDVDDVEFVAGEYTTICTLLAQARDLTEFIGDPSDGLHEAPAVGISRSATEASEAAATAEIPQSAPEQAPPRPTRWFTDGPRRRETFAEPLHEIHEPVRNARLAIEVLEHDADVNTDAITTLIDSVNRIDDIGEQLRSER